MSDTITQRVKEVMALTFNIPVEEITDDATRENIGAWDSIGHANLVLGLEEAFETALSDDVVPILTSVPAITEHLRQSAVAG